MPVTATITNRNVVGNKRQVEGVLTFTGSYTAGGETVTAATFGLNKLDYLDLPAVTTENAKPNLIEVVLDANNRPTKLKIWTEAAGALGDHAVAAYVTPSKVPFQAVGTY